MGEWLPGRPAAMTPPGLGRGGAGRNGACACPCPDPVTSSRPSTCSPPRLLALLDEAETLLARAAVTFDRVDAVAEAAAAEVARVGVVVDAAATQVERVSTVVDGAAADAGRVAALVDVLEPPMTTLQPTLQALADTTHPDEVAALVRLVDHLPALTVQVERDVLPVLTTLGSVAPDLHELLNVSRELNEILGKIPGIGRLKKRVEEEEDEVSAR